MNFWQKIKLALALADYFAEIWEIPEARKLVSNLDELKRIIWAAVWEPSEETGL